MVLFLLSLEAVAFFFSPSPPLIIPAWLLLSRLALLFLRDSPHTALQTKRMDLVQWSLNAIDTIFSTKSRGSGEPACPVGTFVAGYTEDAWERWRVVCLATLSLEDIEDVYLFGIMITGFLLIGLGIALVYRKIKGAETAVKGPQKLPDMIEAVGRAVSTQTVTFNRCMENISEKLTALQRSVRNEDHDGQ